MLETLLKLYVESLKIHIGTKTKCPVFHKFTEEVYDQLFEVFHDLAEKQEDIQEGQYTTEDEKEAKQRIYDIVEQVKELVDENKGDYTTWYDNLARGLVDKLEFLCGNARAFLEEEKEDEEETPIKPQPKKIPKF